MKKIFGYSIPEEQGCLEATLDSLVNLLVDHKGKLSEEDKKEIQKLKKYFPKIAEEFSILF